MQHGLRGAIYSKSSSSASSSYSSSSWIVAPASASGMSGFSGASKPVNFLSFFIFSCVHEPPRQYAGHHDGLRQARQAAVPLDVLSLMITCGTLICPSWEEGWVRGWGDRQTFAGLSWGTGAGGLGGALQQWWTHSKSAPE